MKMEEKLQRIATGIRVTINCGYHLYAQSTHNLPNTDDNNSLFVKIFVDDTDEPVVCNWYSEPKWTVSECYNCEKHCKECKTFDNVCKRFLSGDKEDGAEYSELYYGDYLPHYLWGHCELFPLITKVQIINVRTQKGVECNLFNGVHNSDMDIYHIKKIHYTGNRKKKTTSGYIRGYKIIIHN